MADNVAVTPGTGATIATDDIGGVQYPRHKIVIGADGVNDGDVSAANPLPTVSTALIADDAAFTVATSKVMPVGALADESGPDSVNEGDIGALRMSLNRNLFTVLRDGAGNERGAYVNASGQLSVSIDNTVAHDAVDSGNPLKIGGKARTSLPTAVADADRVDALLDAQGRQVVIAGLNTDLLFSGVTGLTPKFAIIDCSTSGNNTILAAVTSKKIRVLSLFLVAAGTVVTRFEGGADGTALTGQMNLVANTGFVLPFNPLGWFETAVTTLLNLELSAAVSVDGCLCYVEV